MATKNIELMIIKKKFGTFLLAGHHLAPSSSVGAKINKYLGKMYANLT